MLDHLTEVVMSIYQKFRRKNNVSFKFKSYRQKKLPKTPVSFFGFVLLLIATYFLLTLIIEGIEGIIRWDIWN